MILGLNGVVVARHGLILWENDATGVRKVFKYLPGLRDHRKNMKNMCSLFSGENVFSYISIYSELPINRPGGLILFHIILIIPIIPYYPYGHPHVSSDFACSAGVQLLLGKQKHLLSSQPRLIGQHKRNTHV